MIDDRRLPAVVRDQVTKFGTRMAKGLTKPLTKFVAQMIFGILAAKDIKLSNIARGLQEEIPLAKTEERLSRNNRTSKIAESIMQTLVEDGAPWIKADTVLAIDISDVAKEYAEKMEYLATVRDGSKQGELVRGYWLLGVVGADVKGERLTPLLMNLYSQKADDFESENTQILMALDQIKSVIGDRGIWAIDRGGDRRHLLDGLLERSCQFVVRLTGTRNLKDARGKMQNSLAMAKAIHCSETIEIEVEDQGERKHRRVQLGCQRVKLPKRDEWLMLVVIKGFGEKPMLLLTTVTDQSPHGILEIYLTRWKIEESYRFLKSSYHIEDIRVRSYAGLRNTTALVMAAFYFLAVVLGTRFELSILMRKVLAKVRRFFEVPAFKFYALADGVFRVLLQTGLKPTKKPPGDKTRQMSFSFGS